ncbi:MAG TPA: TonB-dependent receptor, partial [Terriglobales bacterium]|nr:TonB-dependent receptor [Terriglobales bacterium]
IETSGATVAWLDSAALETLQPVTAADVLRFLPGAVEASAGRRGGLGSLFVRGGDSRYNKVIVDGVPINDPGGTFDFGVVPMAHVERVEMVRGAESVLYGSDAMTSVVQLWSATGRTPVPEFRFGAEGGTFGTARGYASLAGARGLFDYNLFAEQDHTGGQGVNDEYDNAAQGGNLGFALSQRASLRLRVRHSNNHSGVQSFWNFNGQPLLPPDSDQFARQRNFLASAELALSTPRRWQHRLTAYEYNHRRLNQDNDDDRGCDPQAFFFLDCFFSDLARINRAGFNYQGEYSPRQWARSVFGYEFEVENGSFDAQFLTLDFATFQPFLGETHTRGLRRNHGVYAHQILELGRLVVVGGLRFVHNESFGNQVVPRVSLALTVARGGSTFSGTRLRFAYAEGIKAPRFEESFGASGTFPTNPNPDLQSEETRAFEAGFEQRFFGGRHSLSATYFNNLFRNQIAFRTDPVTFQGQYVNINRSFAHGAEVEWFSRLLSNLTLNAAYVHTSSQILENPLAFGPPFAPGQPLLRRPKHSGVLRLLYAGRRWGGSLAGSFVGRRLDSDFLFGLVPPVDHTAGYARVDLGGWFALNRYATAYVNIENVLNRRYEEVAGYPALKANFRAGMRFRVGGE